ncbi:MAG TPA: DNA-binding domain-containing protein [Oleiagrimonas sp.]|nr:DNA-binding domain-containing protein [Oleiagrimonas sp.]
MPVASSLHEVQQAFLKALYDPAVSGPTHVIVGNRLTPEARLRIYRRSCNEIHTEALRTSYPALLALGGEDWFDQIACRYRHAHPSLSGNLQAFGAHLADYLETLPEHRSYPYFADVARLEWLRQKTMLAPAARVLATDPVVQALRAQGTALQVTLHPSVHLLASDCPVLSLWHFAHEPTPEGPDLDDRGEMVMLWRDGEEVASAWLAPATFACLCALRDGDTLEAAQMAAVAIDPRFNMVTCFESLAWQGLITGVVPFPAMMERGPACL